MIRVALAPCSPLAVPKRVMEGSAALAERYDCRLHTHLCQSLDEDVYAVETFGMRSVDLLEEAGWLSPRAWVAHGIHFNASEIERLGAAGVSVCHCAASDMAFGMGVCPTKELEAAGATIGLGVDGSASNDSSNMMEAVRHSLMLQRLSYGPSAVTPYDALRWATRRLGALPRARRHRRDCARACRPISRSSRSTSRASRARRTRSPRSRSAAPTGRTG